MKIGLENIIGKIEEEWKAELTAIAEKHQKAATEEMRAYLALTINKFKLRILENNDPVTGYHRVDIQGSFVIDGIKES